MKGAGMLHVEKGRIEINRDLNLGLIEHPDGHLAAAGARLCDNRRRDFIVLPDRMTVIGEPDAALTLRELIVSKRVLALVRQNTRFSPGLEPSTWSHEFEHRRLHVVLRVRCAGEYCNVSACADMIQNEESK